MHLLFVDDTFETRDLFRLCFTLAGHTAETAHNGLEALHIIEQNAPTFDLLIIDHHMPDMTGLEVVQQLRHRNDLPPIPIILFTGDATEDFEDQAKELGVARVLYKPILPATLLVAAQEVTRSAGNG